MAETPETTPASEWTVPNQDKLEEVIDARLNKESESEPVEEEVETPPNEDEVEDQAEEPKS